MAHQRGKIIVVWDQGRIHRGSAVRALLAKHPRLEVVDWPAYAPELNPVEFVWSYFKYGRICNLGAKDVHALSGILEAELDQIQDNHPFLKKLWHRSGLPCPYRLLAS